MIQLCALSFGLLVTSTACVAATQSTVDEGTGGIAAESRAPSRILFQCVDDTHAVRLLEGEEGAIRLIVEDAGDGQFSKTFSLDDDALRLGQVSGQMGGSQTHLRITVDNVSYVLLEGVNGALAEAPGETYAAVTKIVGDFESELRIAECDQSAVNGSMAESVRSIANNAGKSPPAFEEPDSAFDGWF